MLDGSTPIALGDSLLLSGIGMLVVFLELILLAVMIVIVSKLIRSFAAKEPAAAIGVTPPAPVFSAPVAAPAPVAALQPVGLTLTDVDEPTAATAMAVVSHQSGIPLNHLVFHSIRGEIALENVEERDAAVIMALTAHQLKKPINRLNFKSIKAVEPKATKKV